jgi:hypothetical protein
MEEEHIRPSMFSGTSTEFLSELLFRLGTLNLRGSDIECCPLFMAYLLVTLQEAVLYVDSNKLTEEAKSELERLQIGVKLYGVAHSSLRELVPTLREQKKKLFLPKNSSYAILIIVREVGLRSLRQSPLLSRPERCGLTLFLVLPGACAPWSLPYSNV